jgi:hypothetical protein
MEFQSLPQYSSAGIIGPGTSLENPAWRNFSPMPTEKHVSYIRYKAWKKGRRTITPNDATRREFSQLGR